MNLPNVVDVNDYKNLLAFSTNLRGAVSLSSTVLVCLHMQSCIKDGSWSPKTL